MKESIVELVDKAIANSDLTLSPEKEGYLRESMLRLLEKHEPVQNVFGISDQLMENLYQQGYNLFQAGKYRDAIKIFESLRYLNRYDSRYSLAIGASFHYLKEYAKAAANYMMCENSDPFNPIPSFHLYDCLMKIDQPLLAADALANVISRCGENSAYQQMKEKALLEKEHLIEYLKNWLKVNYDSLPKVEEN